jgi:hypothetical protein
MQDYQALRPCSVLVFKAKKFGKLREHTTLLAMPNNRKQELLKYTGWQYQDIPIEYESAAMDQRYTVLKFFEPKLEI